MSFDVVELISKMICLEDLIPASSNSQKIRVVGMYGRNG